MTRPDISRWVEAYERAWRAVGTEALGDLFAPDVTYQSSPFEEPLRGLDALAMFWEAEREGPDETFVLAFEPVAVEGDVGVARVEVRYGDPAIRTYRDLWVITLDADGRCVTFEEWPFFPGQPRVAS